jgi:hypothetical protein
MNNLLDGCMLVGDIFEIDHWFKVEFKQPDNGESLHTQDLIQYTWSGTWAEKGAELYEYNEKQRVARFQFKKVIEPDDSALEISYAISVVAKDLRFTDINVSSEDTSIVSFKLPCVFDGNFPTFSIEDYEVTEPAEGILEAFMTVRSSEAVLGPPITIDFCSSDITATSISSEIEVQHVAYDQNDPPEPYLSYLDFGDVRVVFDASFPKFYNSRRLNPDYDNARLFLKNAIGWMNRKRGKRVLLIGERDFNRNGQNGMPNNLVDDRYQINGVNSSGFLDHISSIVQSEGYTLDTIMSWDFGALPGLPTVNEFLEYDVVLYLSSWAMDPKLYSPLSSIFVSSLESAVRQLTGLMIITDHSLLGFDSFAVAGNQIAERFFATFSGNIDRTEGTDFDAVRSTYGDHPLIAGITGTMPGDVSEGKVETNLLTIKPDYAPACGSLTFEEGDSSKTISVLINTDILVEQSETLSITVENPSRGSITRGVGILTIKDRILPKVVVSLSAQGVSRQLFIGRDTSGSTDTEDVEVNGASLKSRRYLIEQILKDFSIANCLDPIVVGHNLDGCSVTNPLIDYTGFPGASASLTVEFLQSVSSQVMPNTEEISVLVINDSSDDVSTHNPSTLWQEHLGSFPKDLPVTLTFIRVCSQINIEAVSGNFYQAKLWFEEVIDKAPPNVIGYFKSFSSYITGGDGELNNILKSTVNNEYIAFCSTRPNDILEVSAPDEVSALAIARGLIVCP